MINYKLLCCAAVVIGLAVAINAHTAGTRHLLQQNEEQSDASAAWDEAKSTVADTFAKFWGGSCVADSQCADPVAHCSSTENECRPVWWFWLIIASVVASLVLSCICCICCGLCACIADCLCCCCR